MIIRVLDEENAWSHVIMNYVAGVRAHSTLPQYKTNGQPDTRNNVSRLMVKLNEAIDNVMLTTDPDRET